MDIILLETVPKLGTVGDVVTVKGGYARNYLIPKNRAIRASKENKALFAQQKMALAQKDQQNQRQAHEAANLLGDATYIFIRQAGDSGRLYGSINARDIARKISEKAPQPIGRDQIRMDPIKELGLYTVEVFLHGDVSFNCRINVARSEEEAALQEKEGGLKDSPPESPSEMPTDEVAQDMTANVEDSQKTV